MAISADSVAYIRQARCQNMLLPLLKTAMAKCLSENGKYRGKKQW
jgi:hypothetical protein